MTATEDPRDLYESGESIIAHCVESGMAGRHVAIMDGLARGNPVSNPPCDKVGTEGVSMQVPLTIATTNREVRALYQKHSLLIQRGGLTG